MFFRYSPGSPVAAKFENTPKLLLPAFTGPFLTQTESFAETRLALPVLPLFVVVVSIASALFYSIESALCADHMFSDIANRSFHKRRFVVAVMMDTNLLLVYNKSIQWQRRDER